MGLDTFDFKYHGVTWSLSERLPDSGLCVVPAHVVRDSKGLVAKHSSGPLVVQVGASTGEAMYVRNLGSGGVVDPLHPEDADLPWADNPKARDEGTRACDVARVGFTR